MHFSQAIATVYYWIQIDIVQGNTYVIAVVMGACELPLYAAIPLATKSGLGRTTLLSISLFVAGVAMSFTAIASGDGQ